MSRASRSPLSRRQGPRPSTAAYAGALPAWQWFPAHTQGEPLVLVGGSQGSAVLIHLISPALDHEPSVLTRLLAALIVGGNPQVLSGRSVGATFRKAAAEAACRAYGVRPDALGS